MTRRALLVPLFAAAFILAPSKIAGLAQAAPARDIRSEPFVSLPPVERTGWCRASHGAPGIVPWETPIDSKAYGRPGWSA